MNTKRGIIGLGLLAAGVTPMWAQDIKGVVIDQKSKETLIGAVITAVPGNGSKNATQEKDGIKAVTDIDGNFSLLNLKDALSLLFSTVIGLVISALIALFHRPLLAALGAQGEILEYGCEYLLIVGGFIFTQSLLNSVTAILRSHGHTRISMYVTAIMNLLNAVLDTAFVLGLFGLPSLGVRGVAIATTLARVVGVAILCVMLFRHVEPLSIFSLLRPFPREEGKKILLVGLPSAFESINYNVAQLVVTGIIFRFLSDSDFITKTYFSNIVIFFYVFSNSIAQGAQILVGYHMGNGEPDQADRVCMRSLRISLVISMAISIGALFVRRQLMMIFTNDPVIVQAGAALFFIDLFVEFGRTFNIVVINGLRGAGDTVYPSVVAVFSMWLVSTLGSFILAVPMGLGLRGIWIAFAADECLRGLLMQLRWKSGKWRSKSLYSRSEDAKAANEDPTVSALS